MQVRIPTKHDKIGTWFALEGQSSPPHSPSSLIGMGTYGDRDSFRLLFPILTQVHLLWELVLTAEPLVVMASTPGTCSEMVQALIGSVIPAVCFPQIELTHFCVKKKKTYLLRFEGSLYLLMQLDLAVEVCC